MQQRVQYELYAAGLDAVTAGISLNEDARTYNVDLNAQTRGLLAKFVPWQGSFHSEGVRGRAGEPLPLLHVSTAKDRKNTQVQTYRYGGDGSFRGYSATVNGRDSTPKDIDPALTAHTTDALSAALAAMDAVAGDRPCSGQSEIFDGERRYRLVFHDMGPAMLPVTDYSVYSGPAEKCSAEVVPLAGRWHAKPRGWMSIQEQGRKQGSLPLIWMAKMAPGAPAVPVRVQVATDYGTLVMQVTSYHNDASSHATDRP